MRWLIKHGNLFLEDCNGFRFRDMLIDQGRILEISESIHDPTASLIELNLHYYVIPGLIDLHCHLREPGQSEKETIKTGTQAAAKGGYTRITAMANTNPPISTVELFDTITDKISKEAIIPVIQAGTISQNLEGQTLSDVLKKNKCHVYSDDGFGIENPDLLVQAIKHAKQNKLILLLHEEFKDRSSPEAESDMVERDLLLSESLDYRIHFTHLSSRLSINALEKAKDRNQPFTADVTPHHLFFSDYSVFPKNPNFKVKPPICTLEDQNALIKAINDKIVQYISTDHAPHTKKEKESGYELAPYGISGFETAFSACYTALVKGKKVKMMDFIPLFTSNPAKLLGVFDQEGSLAPGKKANLMIMRRDTDHRVQESDFISKGKNSPFIGRQLQGWNEMTMLEGEIIYEDGNTRIRRR